MWPLLPPLPLSRTLPLPLPLSRTLVLPLMHRLSGEGEEGEVMGHGNGLGRGN